MNQHFKQSDGFVGFDVAAILKHSCNIRDWIPACAGMMALCVLF